MQLCAGDAAIRAALERVRPYRVAVAYIGNRWDEYLDRSTIEEYIVSPQLGTNAAFVMHLLNKSRPPRVYLLEHLHSKIYLGSTAALVGSCNLSRRALNGQQTEAAMLVTNPAILGQLSALLDDYRNVAEARYRTKESKLRRLARLEQETKRVGDALRRPPPSLADWDGDWQNIHIAWWEEGEAHYNEEAIRNSIPAIGRRKASNYLKNRLGFAPGDNIESGDWILTWPLEKDNRTLSSAWFSWLHADHVIPNGELDPEYSTLVAELKAENRDHAASRPFMLSDPATQAILRRAVSLPQFRPLLRPQRGVWRLSTADGLREPFFRLIRSLARRS